MLSQASCAYTSACSRARGDTMRALLNDGTLSASEPLGLSTKNIGGCASTTNRLAIMNAPDSSNNGHLGVSMVRGEAMPLAVRWWG